MTRWLVDKSAYVRLQLGHDALHDEPARTAGVQAALVLRGEYLGIGQAVLLRLGQMAGGDHAVQYVLPPSLRDGGDLSRRH